MFTNDMYAYGVITIELLVLDENAFSWSLCWLPGNPAVTPGDFRALPISSLSHPGEVIGKLNHGNWTFLGDRIISLLIQLVESYQLSSDWSYLDE